MRIRRCLGFGLLTLTALASAASAQVKTGRTPEAWALVAGVDLYEEGSGIPNCPGALGDAREVARWFQETAGWGNSHLIKLDRAGDTRPNGPFNGYVSLLPTLDNLEWAISQIAARVQPGDFVLIYFAGQAGALPAEPGADSAGEIPLLYASDARANDPGGQVWHLERGIDRIASKGSISVLCWLDTSLSGRGKTVPNVLAPPKFVPSGR
ncbi:MAG TPA: hypothetical protein VFT74_17155, partial [Isosphaeraceae bacterium]|nr:hypothetical protein [Isosphaeraceae bacterium]